MKKGVAFIVFLYSFLLFFSSSSVVYAEECTYNSSLSNHHIDVQVKDNNFANLGVLEIVSLKGPVWNKLYQPASVNWVTSWDDIKSDVYYGLVGGNDDDTAYWGFNAPSVVSTRTIPYGIYGADSTIDLNLGDYYVQMDHPEDLGTNYIICNRLGDVDYSTPTPIPTLTPSPTPTETPTPTQTPSPTPTPSPIPTPSSSPNPTQVPVTKVFFIPGMGASWNVDAFINCKNSGYSGGWTLMPYAKQFYQDLLNELSVKNWTVKPFYYDWRQDVRNNSNILNNYINSNTSSSEKIDLVGHSMGGLVGRNYLETQNGGKASKFLAVGVPFQGTTLSYPLTNGEVWLSNPIENIAATLFINHCGIFPSVQNTLPTYNYLRDNKTKLLKDISTMKTKNNLPSNFVSPFWGVKVGTLSGVGQSTLKIIDVIKDNRWPDGKPVGREYTKNGDGTVLTQSSQIDGALNMTINQTHSGLTASTEGINKILEFLGSPGIADPPYTDPKSALILVGYPGTFSITDKSGAVTQSDHGMIGLMNPVDGSYQLQINPGSVDTQFVISQFMPNGQTFYKEYKFKNINLEPKVIEFDSRHPKDDILHSMKDFPKPVFPKFWLEFWKYWNRLHK
jgi:pimeloyl-ACP methyl ester carboxylesterase